MALADSDLLCAAQSATASPAIRNEFADRFMGVLRYYAGRYCVIYKLDLTMIDDIVSAAVALAISPCTAQFDPARGQAHLTYLMGLVQNAAKCHGRFIHRGAKVRHDWNEEQPASIPLPTCVEEIADGNWGSSVDLDDIVARVLAMADQDELNLINRHFFDHETIEAIADSIGVARTTVGRRLARFYARAAAQLAA